MLRLNTTQMERWQRTEDGQRRQMRLFTDREGQVPVAAEDVAEVQSSSVSAVAFRRLSDRLQAVGRARAARFWGRRLGGLREEVPRANRCVIRCRFL